MNHAVKAPKKLIEVALPLDAINAAAAREKSIRHGHPSTLHLWWARRPLAAARAVIFSQLVNDPSWKWEMEHSGEVPPSHLKASWASSRKRLFGILEDLVLWENTTNEAVLEKARAEIRKSWREVCELNRDHPQSAELFNPDKLPGLHDPFAGGGAIPLEAQRLGLEAFASDLNPVAVLINKAMIEIPPKFAGRAPVGPIPPQDKQMKMRGSWPGATGLAEDVRRYGAWMREEAQKRIGHLYPPVEVTAEMAVERPDLKPYVGKKLTVIAWIWARTVCCPNPACSCQMPLLSSLVLSSKKGKECYLNPVIEGNHIRFSLKGIPPANITDPKKGFKKGMSGVFECAFCGTVTTRDYVARQATQRGLDSMPTAVVAEGERGRVYLPVDSILMPLSSLPSIDISCLDVELAPNPRDVWCRNFGLLRPVDLFTPRQLAALTTFSDLVIEAREKVRQAALAAGMSDDSTGLDAGGTGATAYAEAVAVYLALTVSRLANRSATLNFWDTKGENVQQVFARQALPMTWDFVEGNAFSNSTGNFIGQLDYLINAVLAFPQKGIGIVVQDNATIQSLSHSKLICTDPPYYDNIGYADLSDFFYVWLRRTLKPVFPDLFATLAVPKAEELVATPYRHGSKEKAEEFFLDGMTQAMSRLAEQTHQAFPVTIFYAFKQSESKGDTGTSSTGWETFLDAVSRAGFAVTGTWPMRTEYTGNLKKAVNALASSIVLVCRPRAADAPTISRRQFLRELNQVLPEALDEMTRGSGDDRSPVAPVDLSQAIIGPGMAVFSKYAAVLEADGTPMSIRTALQLINRFLAEDDFDADTQFCLHWFEQNGWKEGAFGDADILARAKGTSVDGVRQTGVLYASGGVVRLLRWAEYPSDWDPRSDTRLPVWEALHQLIRIFKTEGESGTGAVLAALEGKAEAARQLAYRLYTLCERAGWAEDARAYNEIIASWSAIESAAVKAPGPRQMTMFDQ